MDSIEIQFNHWNMNVISEGQNDSSMIKFISQQRNIYIQLYIIITNMYVYIGLVELKEGEEWGRFVWLSGITFAETNWNLELSINPKYIIERVFHFILFYF